MDALSRWRFCDQKEKDNRLLQIIKSCLLRTFDYQGREGKMRYFLFLRFQLVWFCSYLQWLTGPRYEIGLIPLLLVILPTFSCGVRRANDAGYSRGVIAFLSVAPYLLFPFLLFPRSREKA